MNYTNFISSQISKHPQRKYKYIYNESIVGAKETAPSFVHLDYIFGAAKTTLVGEC